MNNNLTVNNNVLIKEFNMENQNLVELFECHGSYFEGVDKDLVTVFFSGKATIEEFESIFRNSDIMNLCSVFYGLTECDDYEEYMKNWNTYDSMNYKYDILTDLHNMYRAECDDEFFGTCACLGCDCPNDVDDGHTLCDDCAYEPDWTDAFKKFGHNDGESCKYVTSDVVGEINNFGYWVNPSWEEGWGLHNRAVITQIRKDDENGEIVYPIEGFDIGGYDARDFFQVLPNDIVKRLEIMYPTYEPKLFVDCCKTDIKTKDTSWIKVEGSWKPVDETKEAPKEVKRWLKVEGSWKLC
jgi:hypothetical protein